MDKLCSQIATYPLTSICYSGIISDNRLYVGGDDNLHIYEVTSSITQPLIPAKVIDICCSILKLLRVGHKLIMAEGNGYLEVFDIKTSTITGTQKFIEGVREIYNLIAIDDTHYLLATDNGLLKITKDQVIKKYH